MSKSKKIIIMILTCFFILETNSYAKSKDDLINENRKIKNNLDYLIAEKKSTHTVSDNKVLDNVIINLKVKYNINERILQNWPNQKKTSTNSSNTANEVNNSGGSNNTNNTNGSNNNSNIEINYEYSYLSDKTVNEAVSIQYKLMQQKSSEIATLVKEITKYRNKIAKMEMRLIGLDKDKDDINEFNNINAAIEKIQDIIDKKNALISSKTDELFAINEIMQNIIANAEKVGDPVDVTTGEFFVQYLDFTAQDYLDAFEVKRSYKYGNYKESFGPNWISSLDSRIIRCNYNDLSDLIKEIEEIILKYEQIINECNGFQNRFNTYTYEIINYYNDAMKEIEHYKKELQRAIELEKTRKEILKRNKYVAYGRYEKLESHLGYENNLIFLDEKGFEHHFKYKGSGIWKEIIEEKSLFLELRSVDKNGNCYDTNFPEGGYELIYKSGERILFSPFGIYMKKIDRNNNETIFNSIDGNINEIILKTGEKITIERNKDEFITSIKGDVSGGADFTYVDGKLQSVKDNNGIVVSFVYDESNHLIKIVKADNSFVKLSYEFNKELGKDVCISVLNENNQEEKFTYDIKNKIVYHDFYGTGNEYYKIDDRGNTCKYKNFKQQINEIIRDENGNIKSIIENGNRQNYLYNTNGLIEQIIFQNGKIENFKYNNKNQVIGVYDNDGVINTYKYDSRGNLTRSYLGNICCGEYYYYDNGLIKKIIENNVEYNYKYNKYGSIIEKNVVYPEGTSDFYKWEYNQQNKLIKYYSSLGEEIRYQYGNLVETIIEKDKETTKLFNNRGWLLSETVIDLKNGIKNYKEYKYDFTGNIVKIFMNGKLFTEYDYYNNGILSSMVVWNNPQDEKLTEGLKIDYIYNENWRIISERRTLINKADGPPLESVIYETYKYHKSGNNTVVSINKKLNAEIKRTYDNSGRLIREDYGNNYYIIYTYSKAGRLIQQRDSDFNIDKYFYGNDGSFKIISENYNGLRTINSYNNYGQLQKVSNDYGFEYLCKYDSKGNLLRVKGINFQIENKYDNKNRLISFCEKDDSEKIVQQYSVVYDDTKRESKVLFEDLCMAYEKRDCFNRVIEYKTNRGHFFYKYDCLGNCIYMKDVYGNVKRNEFSPLGDVIKTIYDNGEELNYKYDLCGNIIKLSNRSSEYVAYEFGDYFSKEHIFGTENNIFYNKNMELEKYKSYDTGEVTISFADRMIYRKDNYNNIYKYELDEKGRIISEENPLGEKQKFKYDVFGSLKEIITYSGIRQLNTYNLKENLVNIEFDSGEKIKIKKNILGQITDLTTNDYSLHYEYDNRGNLVSEYSEKTNTYINFKYDEMNRCVEKSSSNFIFNYEYDLMSRVSKIENHNSGDWVKLTYDSHSRILKKTYSNGCTSDYSYNKDGQIEYMVSRNKLGAIIHGDFIVYDNFNRVSIIGDSNGNFKKYSYDKTGRVIKTIYPFAENIQDFFLMEAAECGYFIDETNEETTNSLELEDVNFINELYVKAGMGFYTNVNKNQKSWVEEYEYDKNGNIISVKNQYGTIIYSYDKLNRIISKNYSNTNSEGVKIKWNKDNCIQEYRSKLRKINFEYGAQKRPIKIISENIYGEINIVEYFYDGFGRRVIEKSKDRNIEYIYDGISTNILSKQYITDNDFVLNSFQNKNKDLVKGSSSEFIREYNGTSSYRVVNNSEYKPFGSNKVLNIDQQKLLDENHNKDLRTFSVLGIKGNPFIISFNDGNGDVNFPITNYSNEIIGYINQNSDLIDIIDYDSWGNINGVGNTVAYTGAKTKDENFNFMFNLGLRDYIPLLKSFSSEDPMRKGNNWYAYCACDPINYEDSYGLMKKSCFDIEYLKYVSQISKYLKFNEDEFIISKLNGEKYMGISPSFDCADCLAAIIYTCFGNDGFESYSIPDVLLTFGEYMDNDNDESAKKIFSSADVRAGYAGTKICQGFDRDFLKNNKNNPEVRKVYRYLEKKKKEIIDYLKTPGNVRIGDCLVWGNSVTPDPNAPEQCGHVVVILSIDYDENGIPIGFVCFEGHKGKPAERTYISIEPKEGCYSLDDYYGDFQGVRRMFNKKEAEAIEGCGK